MKRLITVRHGQSEGNKQRIIQGKANNYGLTESGKKGIEDIAKQYLEEFSQADKIISSPYKRTIQTSEIISDITQKRIETSEDIVEFDSGILAGKNHSENAQIYPEYYKIWMDRKDLDGIPGAETGSELQARALAFLMKYYDKKEFADIIVSHAGFLRCLINTAKGLPRTTPVDSKNGAVTILDNPLENLKIIHKDRAMASRVFVVNTVDETYVVKQKNRKLNQEDYEEKRILNELSEEITGLPSILYMSGTDNECQKVLKYVDGESCFGILDSEEEEALIKKVSIIMDKLESIKSSAYEPEDIYLTIQELAKNAQNKYVKSYAEKILRDSKNKSKLENSKYTLIHNDLNRDNILFSKKIDGSTEANIIDWEGLGLYPEDYQLASFLTSAFLIEGYSVDKTMEIAEQLNCNIDKDFITYLMKMRIFKGLHYFVENRNEYTQSNLKASNGILKKYFFAAENLDMYRQKNGFDVSYPDSEAPERVEVIYTEEER